jgi:cell division protein FtsB
MAKREDSSNIWQHLSRLTAGLVLLLLLPSTLVFFWPELDRRREMGHKLAELEAERDALVERRNHMAGRVEWIRSDLEYFELEARKWAGKVKEGEYLIRIHREGPER